MKTRIKTLVVLTALLLIGATQTDASQTKWRKAMFATEVDSELALTLEDWMIDEHLWSIGNTAQTEETDKPLVLENWMTDETLW